MSDLIGEVQGKPLWEHAKEEHGGGVKTSWYKMTLTKTHRTALQRQMQEALNIENSRADLVLNKKSEWNGSKIPRLRVEVGADLVEETRKARKVLIE